jgi:hypothetical protein
MGDQYRDTGWFGVLFTTFVVFCVLFNIVRARGGKSLFIRRIAGLNAIDEAVGRATEMGRPIVMVPGLSDTTVNAKSMQAINIFGYVARIAARFATPILVCCYNSGIYAVSQEIIRDVYQQEGLIDRYDVDSVRFISDRQFAFAAGVSGLILREKAAAAFFMGEFYAESLILAESANTVGAIQVASSTEITQTPFFIAACDYVLIGDEFYAASAYLTRQPVLVGSLIGQDWGKLTIAITILLGVLSGTYAVHSMTDIDWDKQNHIQTIPPRHAKPSDSIVQRLLTPKAEKDAKIEREKYLPDEVPKPDKGDGS